MYSLPIMHFANQQLVPIRIGLSYHCCQGLRLALAWVALQSLSRRIALHANDALPHPLLAAPHQCVLRPSILGNSAGTTLEVLRSSLALLRMPVFIAMVAHPPRQRSGHQLAQLHIGLAHIVDFHRFDFAPARVLCQCLFCFMVGPVIAPFVSLFSTRHCAHQGLVAVDPMHTLYICHVRCCQCTSCQSTMHFAESHCSFLVLEGTNHSQVVDIEAAPFPCSFAHLHEGLHFTCCRSLLCTQSHWTRE